MTLHTALLNLLLLTGVAMATACNTDACVELGVSALLRMNRSADPCHDFYEFACGGFAQVASPVGHYAGLDQGFGRGRAYVEANMQLAAETEARLFRLLTDFAELDNPKETSVARLLGAAFASCQSWQQPNAASRQRRSLRTLRRRLAWRQREARSLEQLLAAHLRSGFVGLFDFELGFGSDEVRLQPGAFDYTTDADAMGEALRQLRDSGLPAVKADAAARVAADVARIVGRTTSRAAAAAGADQADFFDGSLADLAKDDFDWTVFMASLLEPKLASPPRSLRLRQLDAASAGRLQSLLKYFSQLPAAHAKAFLVLDAFFELQGLLFPGVNRKALADDDASVRWFRTRRNCLQLTTALLGPATVRLYARRHLPAGSLQSAANIGEEIRQEMREFLLSNSELGSSDERAKLLKEFDRSVRAFIGYQLLTDGQLDEIYGPAVAELRWRRTRRAAETTALSLALECRARHNKLLMMSDGAQLPQPDPFRWLSPFSTNAFTVSLSDSSQTGAIHGVALPMAMMQPPTYQPDYPAFGIYGGIGYLLGHEFGHSLNRLRPHCADRKPAKEELLSDHIGLVLAYRAFHKHRNRTNDLLPSVLIAASFANRIGLNSERLFFIRVVQGSCYWGSDGSVKALYGKDPIHPTVRQRVNALVRGFEEFGRAFNCPLGTNASRPFEAETPSANCSVGE